MAPSTVIEAIRMRNPRARAARGFLLLAVCAALIVGVGVIAWHWQAGMNARRQAAPTAPPIPVETVAARRADVPIYVDGLGTVQAFNAVTIKSRVDGQIQKISFVEGQHVKPGDLLVQIDPRPYQAQYDQTVAKKAQDEAQLANANLDLQRYATLLKTEAAPRQQVDTQRALIAQLEATIRADQAAIDAAKAQLGYAGITSPIDGVTGIRQVDQGNIVHAADTNGIVLLTQLQPIAVVFTLPEEDLPSVSTAMAAGPLTVAALSHDGKTEFDRGTVLLIDNQIDQTTGTMRLKATFPNERGTLWPGQFVNIRLLLKTDRNVLTIPSAAVQRGPDGLYAYVVGRDDAVEMRALKIGTDADGVAVIDGGLADGERVVTAGQYRLEPGARVQIGQASPADRDGARRAER
jgi:membrane fusion protein, multidrug efflux system